MEIIFLFAPLSRCPMPLCFLFTLLVMEIDFWNLTIVVVQSLSRVRLFETPWTAARQASLSITISQNLLKLMFIKSVMPSNHLTLNLSHHQGLYGWVSSSHQVAKALEPQKKDKGQIVGTRTWPPWSSYMRVLRELPPIPRLQHLLSAPASCLHDVDSLCWFFLGPPVSRGSPTTTLILTSPSSSASPFSFF